MNQLLGSLQHESLYARDTLDHTLVNPNQLRHYGTQVQDKVMSEITLSIITEDREFNMEISM